jgi:hypothetical protein
VNCWLCRSFSSPPACGCHGHGRGHVAHCHDARGGASAAIIPLHAVTQLASNVSRAAFGWRDIDPAIAPAVLVGAAAGALYEKQDAAFWSSLAALCSTLIDINVHIVTATYYAS